MIFLTELGSFGCLEKNLQPIDGRCKQYTHKHSTYRAAQHDHANTRCSSRFSCIFAPCKKLSSTCYVSPLAVFLHEYTFIFFSYFHRLQRHPQYIWSTMNIRDPMNDHTATISDRVGVSRRQSLPQFNRRVLIHRSEHHVQGWSSWIWEDRSSHP